MRVLPSLAARCEGCWGKEGQKGALTGTHLSNFGQIPQVEGVVALVRRGQQLSTDSVVSLHCAGHNGAAKRPEVGGPVCQEAPQDGGQNRFDGSV